MSLGLRWVRRYRIKIGACSNCGKCGDKIGVCWGAPMRDVRRNPALDERGWRSLPRGRTLATARKPLVVDVKGAGSCVSPIGAWPCYHCRQTLLRPVIPLGVGGRHVSTLGCSSELTGQRQMWRVVRDCPLPSNGPRDTESVRGWYPGTFTWWPCFH